ncbi:MAG TPA: hypothetical protein ENJ11_00035 [Gammaproteobacteria bacterium]|nr:hypothetical protein [Gammaproteobacteria bacterium]
MMQKRTILLLLAMLLPTVAVAGDYDEQQLKTLFTDKKERDYIDALRSGKSGGKPVKKVTVEGYVTRSNGKSVVWVNGKSTLRGNTVDNIRVNPHSVGRNKSVIISSDGKSRKLKPGETWDRQTGKVIDGH